MYRADYHHHSRFSFDGKDDMETICQSAANKNLNEICFTEHFDADPKDVSFGVLDYEKYHASIEACKEKYSGRLKIKRGLEIGEPHLKPYTADLKRELAKMDLDFIIGSVHNINSVKLRLTMPHKTKSQIYADYFSEISAMAKTADIDVIGHMDLMKRYAFSDYGNYDFQEFKNIIEQILRTAVDRRIGLEINTSGFRNSVGEIYPKTEILHLYKKMGGEIITVGSDSHSAKDCFAFCEEGCAVLKDCGFKYIYTFDKRKPVKHAI